MEPDGRWLPLGKVHLRWRRRHRAPRVVRLPADRQGKAFDVIDVLVSIGNAHVVSAAQIALAWLLAQDVTTSVIIGARRPGQLEDNLKSTNIELSSAELTALDEVSCLAPEYPAWMNAAASDDRLPGQERRFTTTKPSTKGKP